jgi:hypothetical protein
MEGPVIQSWFIRDDDGDGEEDVNLEDIWHEFQHYLLPFYPHRLITGIQ